MKTDYEKPFDPILTKLKDMIASKHRVPEYTTKDLIANKHVEGFCQIARHYAMVVDIPISYVTESWLQDDRVLTSITKITLYDSLTEFKADKAEIYQAKDADIPNLN